MVIVVYRIDFLQILKHDLGALIDCEEDNDILKKNILIIVKRHRELLR